MDPRTTRAAGAPLDATARDGSAADAPFTLADRLRVLPQYLLPKALLTRVAGRVATSEAPWTRRLISPFIARYGVDMSEAAEPDPSRYASFNDFFTRALREGVRPLSEAPYVCPVDGAVSRASRIESGTILQVKGHRYGVAALLGGDAALAAAFEGGDAVTLYLSPRDYHRIHMPCDGRLRRMIYVPGSLFSVNPATVRGVPGLFARNERVVCVFDSASGPFVLTLVAATIVGGMATVWHGVVNAERDGTLREWRYDDREVALARGAEMGRFLVGSTVVMLFTRSALRVRPDWTPGRAVRLGESMGDPPAP
jgi:phosphatidylserine decarboxylase